MPPHSARAAVDFFALPSEAIRKIIGPRRITSVNWEYS